MDWWSSKLPEAEDCVIGRKLAAMAITQPDKVFAAFPDGSTWTYSEMWNAANVVAHRLRALGIGHGDEVLSWCTGVGDTLRVWFGTNLLGAVYVPINPAFRGRILEHAINGVSRARVLVADPELHERLDAIELQHLVHVLKPFTDAEVAAEMDPVEPEQPIQPWDPYAILLTSGTTGPSKGVVCSYVHIATTAGVAASNDWFGQDDRYLVSLPIFHAGGVIAVSNGLLGGASIGIMKRFDTATFWDVVRATKSTHATVLGVMGHFLMNAPETPRDRDHTLRRVILGPVTESTPALSRRFGVEVITIFNMTETSVPLVSAPGPTAQGVLGRARRGVEIRVVDEHDREVDDGEPGEMTVRAARPWSMNSGYAHAPDATAQAWRNGWFHTGDVVRRTADGDYFFVDRKKDSIRRRGENISSIELEAELVACETVGDAAVVAVPSEFSEDDVLAVVMEKPGMTIVPEELVEFLRPRVPHYMVPRYIRIVDDLPRTPSNKIEKFKLRNQGVTADTWDREAAGIKVRSEVHR